MCVLLYCIADFGLYFYLVTGIPLKKVIRFLTRGEKFVCLSTRLWRDGCTQQHGVK